MTVMDWIDLNLGASPKKTKRIACFVFLTMLMAFSHVQAHKVNVFAWVEGDTVHVESKFSGGRKPVAATVEVYDSKDHLLLKGETDDKGKLAFKAPQKTAMRIVLIAGMGHRGEWKLSLSDFDNSDLPSIATASQPPKQGSPPAKMPTNSRMEQPTHIQDPPGVTTECVTADEIRSMVEETVDAKLKPVMKTLVDMNQKGPTMTDVLGGIGYILGLIGVAAYIRSKRRN